MLLAAVLVENCPSDRSLSSINPPLHWKMTSMWGGGYVTYNLLYRVQHSGVLFRGHEYVTYNSNRYVIFSTASRV